MNPDRSCFSYNMEYMSEGIIKSLYVHVPFCMAKCRYCDFFSVRYRSGLVDRYLDAVDRELSIWHDALSAVQTVYVGGGTPSVLIGSELRRLTGILAGHVIMAGDSEYTVEANPATLTDEKAAILNEGGVNRISIGVQSFDDRLLSLLGRTHDVRQAEEAVRIAADRFECFSLDLIYGIPGQTEKGWIDTLRRALEFGPHHISAYELTPEKNTPFYHDLRNGRLPEVSEDVIVQMYELCSMILKEHGYEHYEISNYSLPGRESRHNMNYWRRGQYLGIGPAAHSFIHGVRKSNVANIERYCEMLESGSAPVEHSQSVSGAEAIREEIFLGLRTKEGVDIGKIIGSDLPTVMGASISMDELEQTLIPYRALSHVVLQGGRLRLTEKGFTLSSAIIVVILERLGL